MTRILARNYKNMLEEARKNGPNNNGKYIIKDPISGEEAELTLKQLNKETEKANNKIRESQTIFAKIKESFTKGEDNLIDWSKGLELVAGEAHKAADGIRVIGQIFQDLGASEETSEIINDIAESLDGMATTAEGVAQIANGDIIGGITNTIKGLWQTVSTWFDNSNKKIDRQVKDSERQIKQLEIAYANLERAVDKSMGAAEIGARRAAIENKKLQLAELERQLQLEKSRKSKNQDKDKILELESSIASAKNELQDLADEVVNTLLGSDVKSAAEDFVDTWVNAWKEGENTLDAIEEKMDDVIFNLIKKAASSKIVGTILQPFYDMVDRMASEQSEGGVALTESELRQIAASSGNYAKMINEALGAYYGSLETMGIISKGTGNQNLSALQQGIQGVTEDTANAVEAYLNIMSQQAFLRNDLLVEIRDMMIAMNSEVQIATNAEILLSLQQSYQVQMAIQAILTGWSNANGMAVRVEMI